MPDNLQLTPEESRRYARHLVLPEFGSEGQLRLKRSSALIIGAGGLGSPLALYLAAAGVGRIGIVDPDVVDESNLQRQVLHGTSDIGRTKVDSARARLHEINPNVEIVTYREPFTSANAMTIAAGYDVLVDGTDNFPTRYLSNDVAVFLGIPNVYGSIFRFEGQVSVFWAERGPCYRCLFPEPPPPGMVPDCASGGVLGVLPGVVGSLQANETIKLLAGVGEPLIGRLLLYDALEMRFRELQIPKDPACPVCGADPSITAPIDYEQFCGIPGHAAEGLHDDEIDVATLARELAGAAPPHLIDVREPWEAQIATIGGDLIPLGQLAARAAEIPRDRPVVVYCAVGGRSARAVEYLEGLGYRNVRNLIGGIEAWKRESEEK